MLLQSIGVGRTPGAAGVHGQRGVARLCLPSKPEVVGGGGR